jgi:MYXO-CTERM domain-containing protein
MSSLAAELLRAQEHSPGPATHLVILAGVVVTALVLLGLRRWRRRRDAATEGQSTSNDRSAESTASTREE